MRGDARWQAMPRLAQLLRVAVDPRVVLPAFVASSPGGVCATASVQAHRRVTATTASVEISSPRSARLAHPLKK